MIYFTADTHFGHENIVKRCDRPFADAQSMNAAIPMPISTAINGLRRLYGLTKMFICDKPLRRHTESGDFHSEKEKISRLSFHL